MEADHPETASSPKKRLNISEQVHQMSPILNSSEKKERKPWCKLGNWLHKSQTDAPSAAKVHWTVTRTLAIHQAAHTSAPHLSITPLLGLVLWMVKCQDINRKVRVTELSSNTITLASLSPRFSSFIFDAVDIWRGFKMKMDLSSTHTSQQNGEAKITDVFLMLEKNSEFVLYNGAD